MKAPVYTYYAKVEEVIDADTYDLMVDCGFGIFSKQRFRLSGLNCPETWRPVNEAERTHGKAAKALVTKLIAGQTIVVTSHKMGAYGRYDAEILFTNEKKEQKDLAQHLRESGMERKASYLIPE